MSQQLELSLLNELVQPICGQPLTKMRRAVGQVFEFGAEGDFWIKFIWADWRIVQRGRIILGSSDLDGETWFYDSEEPAHGVFNVAAVKLTREFFDDMARGKFVAESVAVGDFADITIQLSNDLVIQSFGSAGEDKDLWWCHNLRTDISCLVGPSGHNVGQSKKQ